MLLVLTQSDRIIEDRQGCIGAVNQRGVERVRLAHSAAGGFDQATTRRRACALGRGWLLRPSSSSRSRRRLAMPRRPHTLALLSVGGGSREEEKGEAQSPPPPRLPSTSVGVEGEEEEDRVPVTVSTPQGGEEPPCLDECPPLGTMPLDDDEEEEEEEEEEEDCDGDGGGWSLEAEMLRRRDAPMLMGQTVELLPLPPQRMGSLASMEEGVGVELSRRSPSVSGSGSLSSSMAAATAADVAPLPPVVVEGPAAWMLQTLRLEDAMAGTGEEEEEEGKKRAADKSKSNGGGGGGGGGGAGGVACVPPPVAQGRNRGISFSVSSSTSSTRSRRIMGMDEPTAVAAALVGMSAFMLSLESVNVKLLGKDVGFWTIAVCRGIVGLACCTISYLAGPKAPTSHWLGTPDSRQFLALRGVVGAAAVISSFAALTNMDLADATALMSTAPLWTAGIGVWVEGTGTWSKYDSAAAVCCTLGVLLVLQPGPLFPSSGEADPSSHMAVEGEYPSSSISPSSSPQQAPRNTLFGIAAAIVCAITTAAFTVMTRYVMQENTSVVAGYTMVACVLLALPGLIYELITRPADQKLTHGVGYDLVQLMLTGLFSYAAHMAKTYAMQITRSLGVVVMRYSNILFAFVFEALLLHQAVNPLSASGAIVIVAGCVASIFAQRMRGQVVSARQKGQPSLSLSSSAAMRAAVIKEAEAAEQAGKQAAVRLPAA